MLAFGMATGVATGWRGSGWWFALPYVALRCVGLGIYLWVAVEHEARRRAVGGFTVMSLIGMIFVLLGAGFHNGTRATLWAVAVGMDWLAAGLGGRRGSYDLDPPHFIERHGLFVILALGESLIAVGVPVPDAERTGALVAAAIAGVSLVCLLWWTYFAHIKPSLEEAILDAGLDDPSILARDVYSLLHFPVLCGIVAMAAAAEEAVAHPQDPLPSLTAGKFAAGLILYIGGLSVAHRRAASAWLWHRLVVAAAGCAAVMVTRPMGAVATLWVGAGTVLVLALWEELVFDTRPLRRAGDAADS
jgi:low temperature requirement protein LtrA